MSHPGKRVRINKTTANAGDLVVNDSKVVQSMTIASQIRLDEFHNLF